MTDLQKAVADLISVHAGPGMGDAFEPLEFANETTGRAFATVISTILNGVVAGDLVSSADAKAAQGLAVELAAVEMDLAAHIMSRHGSDIEVRTYQNAAKTIRALANVDGMALLAELRAERDRLIAVVCDGGDDRDGLAAANAALEEKMRGLVEALEALGAMPEGYCFCSKDRIGDDSKSHEPECRDIRIILQAIKEQ